MTCPVGDANWAKTRIGRRNTSMKRLHIIGGKNHGKTTLIVELVRELARRGLAVGAIKHTHHHHELDVPGKDSYRHRTAGAAVVGILSPGMSAIFLPTGRKEVADADRYAVFEPMFANCQLVLVEGDSQTTAPKIEVWRSEFGTPPLAQQDKSILAVVTDDSPPLGTRTMSRSNIVPLADWIIGELMAG